MMNRRLLCTAALIGVFGTMGCAAGTGVDGEDDGGSGGGGTGGGPTGLAAYAFRAPLTIEQGQPDVVARVSIDHATLVANGSAEADGSDMRLVFASDSGELTELNRVLDRTSAWDSAQTRIFFRTQAADAVGTYYLYYGNASPDAEIADPSLIFDIWDDFDILEEEWQVADIGTIDGDASIVDGAVRVSGTAQDIGGMADTMVFLHRELTGDFRVDVSMSAAGGSLGGQAKTGGIMVRNTLDADSPHVTITLQREAMPPSQRVTLSRDTAGGTTSADMTDAPETFPLFWRVQRVANTVTAQYSEDGASYVSLGQGVNLGTNGPVQVGIPLANLSGGVGEVDTDWFRMTLPTIPDPVVSLGAEEAL